MTLSPPKRRRIPPASLVVAAFLFLLPLSFFARPLTGQAAFLPADLLSGVAPWKTASPASPDAANWNVLRYDGITQFYPWRQETSRQMRAGKIPLWNTHQFAGDGGTPLLANSQSAPLYPLNALFYMMPTGRLWYAFGLSAFVHMTLAAWGMFLLLRIGVKLRRLPSLLGAGAWAMSGPVITWLSLPTFLAVACWIPWLLLLVRVAHERAGTRTGRCAAVGAGAVAGLMMLAGHLQIAFYGLLAGGLYAAHLGFYGWRAGRIRPLHWLIGVFGAGVLALALAAPQVLPSVELSRVSHRATPATMDLYRGYIAAALPPRNLVTLLAPNFFGEPNHGLYWNDTAMGGNNYAEWAAYVGVAPLLLACYAVFSVPWKSVKRDASPNSTNATLAPNVTSDRNFFVGLAVLAAALAMGTPLNLLFFFGVPGWGQTGNPARSLLLWAFALSALAAIGLQALLEATAPRDGAAPPKRGNERAALASATVPFLISAAGMSLAAKWAQLAFPQTPFAALWNQAMPGLIVALTFFALTTALLFAAPHVAERRKRLLGAVLVVLAVGDSFVWGANYNPITAPERVYPQTPGIAFLRGEAKNFLVAPVNTHWSVLPTPPQGAVLPPNAATVYGFRDMGGYDSLFRASSKIRLREQADGADPSPPENGNMAFVKSVDAAVRGGARWIILDPDAPRAVLENAGADANRLDLHSAYEGADMIILENPKGRAAPSPPVHAYAPTSFRVGLFLGLCAVSALACVSVSGMRKRSRVAA